MKKLIDTGIKLLPFIFFIFIVLLDAWLLIVKGAYYIDSDMAADLINAKVLNEECRIISDSWWYSTGIGVFGVANFYQIGLLLFPQNWIYARAFGVIVLNVIFAIVYYFTARCFELDRNSSTFFSAMVIAPIGYWYLEFLTFGGFYTTSTVIGLLQLVVFVSYLKKTGDSNKSKYILWVLIAGIGFFMGVVGIKYAIYPVLPLALTAAFVLFCLVREKTKRIRDFEAEEYRFVKAISLTLVSFVLGYLYNILILSKRFRFDSHSDIMWGKLSFDSIISGVFEFLSLFGYQHDEEIYFYAREQSKINVCSLQGVGSILGILVATFLVFCTVRLIARYRELEFVHKVVLVLFISSVAVGSVVFKLTEGFEASAQYWIPLVATAFLVIQIEICTEDFGIDALKYIITVVLAAFFSVTSIATVDQFQKTPIHADEKLVDVAQFLLDNGYTEGYASFWQSNALVAITSEQIDSWTVWDFAEIKPLQWLQRTSHMNPPTADKVFGLIGPDVFYDRETFLEDYLDRSQGEPRLIYQDDAGYLIWEFVK